MAAMGDLDAYWGLERYRLGPVDLIELEEAVVLRRRAALREKGWIVAPGEPPGLAPCPFRDRLDGFAAGRSDGVLVVRGLGEAGTRSGGITETGPDVLHLIADRLGAPLGDSREPAAFAVWLCPPGARPQRFAVIADDGASTEAELDPGELLLVDLARAAARPVPDGGDALAVRVAAGGPV
ncbi:hypothetical protein EDD29_3528 [Actinocorallia herbida]|uniref:Uncharacterized protein n=1 Tax=Actinocorallia herbida TaxID=58109 RepID=A0A3N1CXF7_9ACTN|nr:hypothetical protein [Actinocorallia herbida]ROO85973.1 hypothetical protein EDD29_3528 [Actinocorallia herbida]